jgi:two-component system, cell cycle sensor histidine kinase and response regulator CckA
MPPETPFREDAPAHDLEARLRESERRAAENLRSSEDTLSRIFQLSRDAISLNRAADGTCLDINDSFERITGWTRAEVLGKSSLSHGLKIWARDADRERLLEQVRRLGQVTDFEAEYRRKDGTVVVGLMSARLIDVHGESCLLSITRDITQRKCDEARLEQQHAVLSTFINSTQDTIFSVDRSYRYTLINNSHLRVLKVLCGIDVRLGDSAVDILPTAEARNIAKTNLDRALAGERVEFDFPAPGECGDTRSIYTILSPVRAADGAVTGVAVFGHDLTDQRRLQAQLLQAQKMEAIGLLAGGIAHDFRNQLTVIIAACELLRDEPGLPPRAATLLGQILDAAHQSGDMTSKLLSFSRKQLLQPRLVDIAELAGESAHILPRLLRPDIKLNFTVESRPLRALLDPVQFQQALLNLAANARDAMPEGGELSICCRRFVPDSAFRKQHPDAAAGYVSVIVSDTGHGMDAATLSRAFEPFFTTKPVGRGTGLGLSMVYGFVRQCAGIVNVQSTPGAGTAFNLLFPEAADQAPAAPAVQQSRLSDLSGNERILVVEDDQAIRRLVFLFLTAAGYRPVECPGAAEALALLRNPAEAFDLLLSDVVMPGLSGAELARQVRQLHPRLPILLISGYTHGENLDRGVAQSACRFLPKPFTRQSLLQAVRDALEGQAAAAGGVA